MRELNRTLNRLNTLKTCLLLASIAFAFSVLLITSACLGKRLPPTPPIEKVPQKIEISGKQFGNQVIISWQMPVRNASPNDVLNISRADVYRLAEKDISPLTLSEEEFYNSGNLIASIPIKETDFQKKILSYIDNLTILGQGVRLRYAVRFVNRSGQKAAFSNVFVIEPTANASEPPKDLSVRNIEEAIILNWQKPEKNVDGTKPANILGFNIYRFSQNSESAVLLNQAPIDKPEFADRNFEFGKEYKYFVRTVSLGKNTEQLESLQSNMVSIVPKDTFAPSSPTAITIAAAPNVLSIFFAVNPEKDVAGYRVFRSTDERLPKDQWVLLTADLLKTNTFQDKSVESGKTYFYYLTAVDFSGNSSEPSEIVSETAP